MPLDANYFITLLNYYLFIYLLSSKQNYNVAHHLKVGAVG